MLDFNMFDIRIAFKAAIPIHAIMADTILEKCKITLNFQLFIEQERKKSNVEVLFPSTAIKNEEFYLLHGSNLSTNLAFEWLLRFKSLLCKDEVGDDGERGEFSK